MLTLQTGFTYDDSEPAPVDHADIMIGYPVYEAIDDTDNGTVTISTTGQGEISFSQVLTKRTYQVNVSTDLLFGPDYGATIIKYIQSLMKANPKFTLSDLTIPFSVRYGTNTNALPNPLDALYFFQGATLPSPSRSVVTPSATGGDTAPRSETPTDTIGNALRSMAGQPFTVPEILRDANLNPTFRISPGLIARLGEASSSEPSRGNHLIDARIFCLNKRFYVDFMSKNFPDLAPGDESLFLYAISGMIDISGPAPSLNNNPDAVRKRAYVAILQAFGYADRAATAKGYDEIIKYFPQFFDFPLKMPKIRLLTLAGVLHINAPPGQVLSMDQFSFYHLSANFTIKTGGAEDEAVQHISRYDWPMNVKPDNDSLRFSFKDKYALNTITGLVDVSVTSYDNSEVFSQEFSPSSPDLQNLNIVVDLRTPPVMTGQPGTTSNLKLRGKVVPMGKNCTLKSSVIVQARVGKDDLWKTVSTGNSDKTGNFTMPYPKGKFIEAQAISSLDVPRVTSLKIDKNAVDTISMDFIYILIQKSSEDGDTSKDDCGCNPTTTAGRLPSQEDLIQSDQYTQDVGGNCMNLSVPNRTLREFNYTAVVRNSDPDVANYTLTSSETFDPTTKVRNVSYQLTNKGKITRRRIDLNNPIQWEDVSSIGANQVLYEAVTVATGHILHYKSEFRADGYSLGNLLYSLPLAPGQKKEIVIIDSSHSFRGTETQALSQSERLTSDLMSERDIVDQIGGDIGERVAGSSEAETGGVSAAAGASGGGMGWGANVGVAGGYAKSSSSAQQNSGRNMSGFFSESLKQGIHQNATSYRQQNSAIVTTANEAQHYQAETTVIANHNHCHTITIMHYEVLRHFAVYQELVDVEECVFIPFPLTKFTMENIAKWADALSIRLLPLHANTYQNPSRFYGSGSRHPLAPAFDAVERVRTNWALVDWPDGPYSEEKIIWIQGEYTASVNIPRPNTRYDMILSMPIIQKQTSHNVAKSIFLAVVTGGLSLLAEGSNKSEEEARANISDKFMRLDANYQTRRPADCMRLFNLDPVSVDGTTGFDPAEFFHDSPKDRQMWLTFATILNYQNSMNGVRQMLKYYFLNATISEWDSIWRSKVAPDIYEKMYQSLSFNGLAVTDFTRMNTYRGGMQQVNVAFSGQAQQTRAQTQFVTLKCVNPAVRSLVNADVEWNLRYLRIAYSTQHYNGLLYNGSVNNDLYDDVTVFCPLSEAETRNPKTEDRWLSQRLISHLNRNLEYYNRVLLYSLDAQRRFMLLDGFHIEVFNENGTSAGYHSLSSVLKNSPVAMAGNSMVFPVSPGYKVDQSMILQSGDGESSGASLLDLYKPEIPTPPYRISVPSKGVYSESMMGKCDSCEKLKPDSSQDWTKFTIDEPPAIGAVQPIIPETTTYNPTTKDFASPMISIQNAPANPDPGMGLAGVTELLGKAGIFKDITGLDANQQNAMKTYLSNQQSALAVAGMAGNMATQSHNTSNSAQIMGTIQQAQDSGILTKAEAGQLVKQHIQSQIDGGMSQKAALEQEKAITKKSLSEAAVAAVTGNKGVEATTVDSEGNVESVKIAPGSASTTVLAKATPAVPIIKQKEGTPTCWAAAATMLASWKAGKTLTPEEALKPAGDKYVTKYTNKEGLTAAEKDPFIKAMGMTTEPPASYPPSTFIQWMKDFGPLWVTTDAALGASFSPHAKILIQIDGDGNDNGENTIFTWINPQNGSMPKQSFKDFIVGYEQMATDNKSSELFTQIVHYADKVTPAPAADGEGFGIEGPFDIKTAVHENLTLSALISSDLHLDPSTTLDSASPDTREFIRGVFWNDDPAVLFFDDKANDNWNFSSGVAWLRHFNWPKSHERGQSTADGRDHYWGIIERSHFWDLQFLHAMASSLGEDPHHTLAKIMLWLEIMYKLSTGQGVSENDKLGDINISSVVNTTTYTLKNFFNDDSQPKASDTVKTLLSANSIYAGLNIKRRAIGTCFHVLEDSYAKGHTRRKVLNPGDLLPSKTEEFKSGTWAQLGEIENFHTYKGQELLGDSHGEHDQWDASKWGPMDPRNPASFNPLWGARMARDRASELANFWYGNAPWSVVKTWFETKVFMFSATITPADATI